VACATQKRISGLALRRYCDYLKAIPFHLPSEQKPHRSPTALVKNCVAPGIQNQAFNAIVFPRPNPQSVVEKSTKAPREGTRPTGNTAILKTGS
jgi:hypothetical protein